MPMSRMISDGGIRDLYRFEQLAANWDPRDFLEWIRRGCRRIRGEEGEAAEQRPFPPLRLFASGDVPEQFGAAVTMAKEQDYDWPLHVEKVVIEHIRDTAFTSGEWEFQNELWRLLAHFETSPDAVEAAANFLHRVEEGPDIAGQPDAERGLDSMAKAVARSSAGVTRRTQFFSDLSRSKLWRTRFLVDYLRLWTCEIVEEEEKVDHQTRRLAWRELSTHLATELSDPDIANRLQGAGVLMPLAHLLSMRRIDRSDPQSILAQLVDLGQMEDDTADPAWNRRGQREHDRDQLLELVR